MSTIELREKLRVLPRAERQEMLAILQEMEAGEPPCEPAPAPAAEEAPSSLGLPPVLVPFDDAVANVFTKHHEVLSRLAK